MSSAHLLVIIRAPTLFPLSAGKFDCPAPKRHPAFLLPRLHESHGVPLARNTPKRSLLERLLRLPACAERERGGGGSFERTRRVLEPSVCRGVYVAEEKQGLFWKRRYGGREGRGRATRAKDSEGNLSNLHALILISRLSPSPSPPLPPSPVSTSSYPLSLPFSLTFLYHSVSVQNSTTLSCSKPWRPWTTAWQQSHHTPHTREKG